jgi:hypothetical protein
MSYGDVNLFGVYVAPASIMMIAAWLILAPLRRLSERLGLLRNVWHPPLFIFSLYLAVLSSIILLTGALWP